MATQDFVQTERHPDSFAESNLDDPLEFWGPPLAPAEDSLRQALGPARKDKRFFQSLEKTGFFQPLEKNDFAESANFGPHRKVIAGSVVVAAVLGITALTYISGSPSNKIAMQSEQSAPPAQSSQASPQPSPEAATSKAIQPSEAPSQPSSQTASSKSENVS